MFFVVVTFRKWCVYSQLYEDVQLPLDYLLDLLDDYKRYTQLDEPVKKVNTVFRLMLNRFE